MIYPETVMNSYLRYLNFFRKTQETCFPKTSADACPVVVMVSHGNSVQSFMEVCDPEARSKDIIGIGYCCLSIARLNDKKGWD